MASTTAGLPRAAKCSGVLAGVQGSVGPRLAATLQRTAMGSDGSSLMDACGAYCNADMLARLDVKHMASKTFQTVLRTASRGTRL